jgi:hypothetical protein
MGPDSKMHLATKIKTEAPVVHHMFIKREKQEEETIHFCPKPLTATNDMSLNNQSNQQLPKRVYSGAPNVYNYMEYPDGSKLIDVMFRFEKTSSRRWINIKKVGMRFKLLRRNYSASSAELALVVDKTNGQKAVAYDLSRTLVDGHRRHVNEFPVEDGPLQAFFESRDEDDEFSVKGIFTKAPFNEPNRFRVVIRLFPPLPPEESSAMLSIPGSLSSEASWPSPQTPQ